MSERKMQKTLKFSSKPFILRDQRNHRLTEILYLFLSEGTENLCVHVKAYRILSKMQNVPLYCLVDA